MAVPDLKTLTRRLAKQTLKATITLGVVGLSGVAVLSSVSILNIRAEAVPDPVAAPPVPVSVAALKLEDGYSLPRRFVGQIEARSTVSLSFELGGKLAELPVEEGYIVESGQLIARLDTDLLQAEMTRLKAARAASSAQLEFAQSRLTRAEQLQTQGFTSTETLDQARAGRDELTNRIAEIDALLAAVEINIAKSALYAPFSGQIAAQAAEVSETIGAGQQIVTVIETAVPELRVGLPLSIDAAQLSDVSVVIAGVTVPATLKWLRPDIDPVTRTRIGLFSLTYETPIIFGQSAALLLDTEVVTEGAWIPVDALQSGEGSVWTVLMVRGDALDTAAVEILHIEGDRAYVRGTFEDGARIVTAGAHRVVSGQTVTVLDAEG